MLSEEKRMEMLELYDLLRSVPQAAELAGVDPRTLRKALAERAAGIDPVTRTRERLVDGYMDKIEEWIDRSQGKIRADVVHDKLCAMGYSASERTTRRVVRVAKRTYLARTHRIYRPWLPEPGGWLQYDFGDGPAVGGAKSVLFCAWLAWSRFRVILCLRDRSLPSVVAALDQTFRAIGGAPTYVLTDNEKTVTDRHIAGIAVRNAQMLSVATYYGITIATCVPFDPESKGGSEATVRVAKADLVPTDYNLLPAYGSWAELEAACASLTAGLNARVHGVSRQRPAEALEVERAHLHGVPDAAFSAAFGETRSVSWSSVVSFRGGRYSVPHTLAGTRVWVRVAADEVVVVSGEGSNAHEVARHRIVGPGHYSITESHYPVRRGDPLHREPRATRPSEQAFLALGEGAKLYLSEAAAAGTRRIETRMAEAVTAAAFYGPASVDHALQLAAMAGRFSEGDLESIIVHGKGAVLGSATPPAEHSLAAGTAAWSAMPTAKDPATDDEDEQ